MRYLISYDLDAFATGPARDYGPLITRLQEHGGKRLLFSGWIVETPWTHTQLRDDIQRFLLPSDRLVIAVISAPAAWNNLMISDADMLELMK